MITFSVGTYPRTTHCLLTIVTLMLASCVNPVDPLGHDTVPAPLSEARAVAAGQDWDRFVGTFMEAYFEAIPAAAVGVGRHEFDGRIPDLSSSGIAARSALFRRFRSQAEQFEATALDRDRRFERDLMIWYLGRRLFWIEAARWPQTNPMFYRGAVNPSVYLDREYAPLTVRQQALTQLLESLPRALQQMRQALQSQIPSSFLKRSIGYYGGLAQHLRSTVPERFVGAGTQQEHAQLLAANHAASAALDALVQDLEERAVTANDEFALGADLFSQMLRDTEMVDVPLAQLQAQGRADLSRNLAMLAKVCEEQLAIADLKACMAHADTQKSGDPVARGRDQLSHLKHFVQSNDLVTIPSEEVALVRQSPPYNRANLAYISMPGAFEPKPLPSVYYISPPDPDWTAAEQRAFVPNEGRLLYVSVHEVWPGHFLWMLHRNRAQRPLVRMFSSTTFSEGWAHYAEEMMQEQGLGADEPLLHVGQLANALMRNVRYLSAIGLHAQGMTPGQSEALFLDKGLLDIGSARQQAARGTYDPGYLSYTLGKLQILSLRERWLTQDSNRTLKQFHDTLLSYGGAPLALVERYMLQP